MRYTRSTLLIISCFVLAACTSAPSSAPIVQRHFTGHLPDQLIKHGLQFNPNVSTPVATHFSSVASLAPVYGLLLDIDPRSQTPAQAALAIERVLNVSEVSQQLLQNNMQQQPRLKNAFRENGRGQLSLTIRRVGILAKYVRETQCQPMIILSTDIRVEKGQLLWTSGFAMNRLDERINYACQGLKTTQALAQKAMTEALDAAISDAVQRMVQP